MNKVAILAALELLKDYLNADGKGKVAAIQLAVSEWVEAASVEKPVEPVAAEVPLEEKPAVVEPVERRAEERDPGEAEQKMAEDLKLTPPVKAS